ncbi:MAG: hypothetical protein ACRDRR_12355 [Pseudonocardiaceae bacterium]
MWRAPVLVSPQQGSPAAATPAEIAYEGSAASGNSVPRTAAPAQPAGAAGLCRPCRRTADPRHGGLFDGLLNSVFHVAKTLSH